MLARFLRQVPCIEKKYLVLQVLASHWVGLLHVMELWCQETYTVYLE